MAQTDTRSSPEDEESRTRPSRRRRRSAPLPEAAALTQKISARIPNKTHRSLGPLSRSASFLPGLPSERIDWGPGVLGWLVAAWRVAHARGPLLRWTQLTEETCGRKSSGWRPPLPTPLSKRVGAPTSFPRSRGVGWPQAWASQPRLSTTRSEARGPFAAVASGADAGHACFGSCERPKGVE